jgi:tRNA threonylcarbamoyladenosine biosynthesis protein TsaB
MKFIGLDTSLCGSFSIGAFLEDKIVEMNYINFYETDKFLSYSIASLLETIEIKPEELDFYAVGTGPGSFTGLRVGISVIKSMAFVTKKPVLPLSSLELLVYSLPKNLVDSNSLIIPLIEATTDRVFTALFKNQERLLDDMDAEVESLINIILNYSEENQTIIFAGNGVKKLKNVIERLELRNNKKLFLPGVVISGKTICELSKKLIETKKESLIDSHLLVPKYIRKSEAEIKKGK